MYLIDNSVIFDPVSGKLSKFDEEIYLGQNAKECLMLLITHKGMIISKEQLIAEVWNAKGIIVSDNALRQTMYTIRKSLKYLSKEHELIITIPRKGYRIELVRTLTESEVQKISRDQTSRLTTDHRMLYKVWARKIWPGLRMLTVIAGVSAAINIFYLPLSSMNANRNLDSIEIVPEESKSSFHYRDDFLKKNTDDQRAAEATLADSGVVEQE